MTVHVREFYPNPISTNDAVPKFVKLRMMGTTDSVAVTEARRFVVTDPTDVGTIVTGATAVSGNTVTVNTIWNSSGDPPAAGVYRFRLICTDSTPTPNIIAEINLYYRVYS